MPGFLHAQEPVESASEDPVHEELRTLRKEVLDAFKKKDVDRLLKCLHEDVIVTLQNAEVCEGHEEVRAFHARMSEGENRSVQSQETVFEVDDLSIIYGDDTAVARGSIQDDFKLTAGMEFQLQSRWSATLVKEDDRWLVASFHASTNMFENGVSDLMLKWNTLKVGGIALLAGIVFTAVVSKLRTRRP
jgi:uncharacterized protein (TIGR02246 family)